MEAGPRPRKAPVSVVSTVERSAGRSITERRMHRADEEEWREEQGRPEAQEAGDQKGDDRGHEEWIVTELHTEN